MKTILIALLGLLTLSTILAYFADLDCDDCIETLKEFDV